LKRELFGINELQTEYLSWYAVEDRGFVVQLQTGERDPLL